MKKRTGMIVGLVALICFLALGTAYYTFHWFTSVDGRDRRGLEQQAAEYLHYEKVYIQETEQRGDYLAALGKRSNGEWCVCVFARDRIFSDRWSAQGGILGMEKGTMGSWNVGIHGNAIMVFGGGDLPEEARWYTFENAGITYTCPVEDKKVLDMFIILDTNDADGTPVLLDRAKREMR